MKKTEKKDTVFLNIVILTSTFSLLGGLVFLFFSTFSSSKSYLNFQVEVSKHEEMMVEKMQSIEYHYAVLDSTLGMLTKETDNLTLKKINSDIRQISSEFNSLKQTLGSDIERTLSVPLLRKDVENLQQQFDKNASLISRDIDRIYDITKWYFGLVITMSVSLIGLAFNALKKKE